MLAMLATVTALTLAAMLSAGWLTQLLGTTGVNAVAHLSGVLLPALAVQFMLDGLGAAGLIMATPHMAAPSSTR